MKKITFQDAVITETVMTNDMLTGMTIGTLQEDFSLNEGDFLRLTSEASSFTSWALNWFFATVGYAISILPKWISDLAGKDEHVSKSEWAALAIGLGVSLLLFGIGKCAPSEKKKLVRRMQQHFKEAPKSRRIFKGDK